MKKIAKIVDEIMKEADSYPHIKRKRRMVTEKFDECPVCSQEIGEKEMFYADPANDLWQHRVCGGFMHPSPEAQQEADAFLKEFNEGGGFLKVVNT